jgi:dTDP-4-dehydrorhamnose reductase
VLNTIESSRPDVLVNCAADNEVDVAEDNAEHAYAVNTHAVGAMARMCREKGIFLVHFSSDYVFDGEKGDLYVEEDPTGPLSVYGRSKEASEVEVSGNTEDFLVFRLSWCFGKGARNFLYKVWTWAKGDDPLKASSDEVSVPTSAEDVAAAVLTALDKGAKGLYHLLNDGYASRYELARYFLERAGLKKDIKPVPMNSFGTRAKRPRFSAMSNGRISAELGIRMPAWQSGVDRFVEKYFKNGCISF